MAKLNPKLTEASPHGGGWIKDDPDARDWTWDDVKGALDIRRHKPLPPEVDLRRYFPPIRDQGVRNSSTAFACLAVVEYFERRVTGAVCERSKEFLCAMTHMAHSSGSEDRGSSIRATLKALLRFGVPPEIYWPYSLQGCKRVPVDHHLYSCVGDFIGMRYARLDLPDSSGKETIKRTRQCLVCHIPVVFGFEVHHLMSCSSTFPLAEPFYASGGQSVVACGYDDSRKCLLVRNSWGDRWGDAGYAWLPYAYVLKDHAADFWIILREDWLDRLAPAESSRIDHQV